MSPRALRFGWPVLLLAAGIFATGCAGVSNPEGWAGPQLFDGVLFASIDKGRMAALDPVAETGADCENIVDDDDDGGVNEGCDRTGQKSESGEDCLNAENDDGLGNNPDDDIVNDGCPSVYALWVFPPDTKEGNSLDLEGIYGAPILDGDTLYFGAYDGNVYAIDAVTGAARWRFETDDGIIGSLALKDDTLYTGSTDGRLYAIDTSVCVNSCPRAAAKTFDTGSSIWASPVVIGDVVYVPDMDGKLHARNAADIDKAVDGFSFQTDAGLLMDPTLADTDTLLVGGIDSELFALDPETGQQKWSQPFKGGNWFWGKPLVNDEVVYVADLDGNVHAANIGDGSPLWAFKAAAAVRSAPVLAADSIVIVDRHGNAYGLKPDDGALNWGPTLLGKTVLSDPFLLQPDATPTPTTATGGAEELLIVAQGGDLCRIDPTDGSPSGASLCAEVPS